MGKKFKMKPNAISIGKWPHRITKNLETYKFELFLSDDFSHLEDINQAYGIVLNEKDQLLLVAGESKHWILPGGGIKELESPEDALKREIFEETAIEIDEKKIYPFFYQKTYIKKRNKWFYRGVQVRYITKIAKQTEFMSDTDGHVVYHKYVNLEKLHLYLKWGKTTIFIQKYLPEILGKII